MKKFIPGRTYRWIGPAEKTVVETFKVKAVRPGAVDIQILTASKPQYEGGRTVWKESWSRECEEI